MSLSPGAICPIRVVADLSLALSLPVLFFKVYKTGHEGISLTTQLLHLLVFLTRYLDLFTHFFSSFYNTFFKIWYIYGTLVIIYTFVHAHRRTHCADPHCLPLRTIARRVALYSFPCLVLSLFISWRPLVYHGFSSENIIETLWAFSLYLAVVADIPQLRELAESTERDRYLLIYMILVFSARALYIPHWIYRYSVTHKFDPITCVCGIAQTVVFAILFRPRGPGRILLATDVLSRHGASAGAGAVPEVPLDSHTVKNIDNEDAASAV